MRQIGDVANTREAERLVDYLAAQGIRARGDENPTDAGVAIWTYEEDQRERALAILTEFNLNPADARYDATAGKARAVAREEAERDRQARRNLIDVRTRWSGADLTARPLTFGLVIICVLAAVTTRFGNRAEAEWWIDQLMITPVRYVPVGEAPPNILENGDFNGVNADGTSVKVNEGIGITFRRQPWRLITPIFLHFGLPHLVFNMLALMTFGAQIELRRGPWFLLGVILVVAVISNVAQYDLHGDIPNRNFGGMSGVVYGLFGYIWMKSRYDPGSRFYMPRNGVLWMLIWMFLCMLGVIGNIANIAHVVGLGVGMVLGFLPTLWTEWRRDERLRRFEKR